MPAIKTYLKTIFGTSETSSLFFPEFFWFDYVCNFYVTRKTFLKIKQNVQEKKGTKFAHMSINIKLNHLVESFSSLT